MKCRVCGSELVFVKDYYDDLYSTIPLGRKTIKAFHNGIFGIDLSDREIFTDDAEIVKPSLSYQYKLRIQEEKKCSWFKVQRRKSFDKTLGNNPKKLLEQCKKVGFVIYDPNPTKSSHYLRLNENDIKRIYGLA